MTIILHPALDARISILIYRFRFLTLYTVFGAISLMLEIIVRSYLIDIDVNTIAATLLAIIVGIFFAFWANVIFNFKIAKSYRNRALAYFVVISCFSVVLQWVIKSFLSTEYLSYEWSRFTISGGTFLVAYVFHRRYSFKDYKKVGVAIYADGVTDLATIYQKIGQYPDFIHVDIVDKTMSGDAADTTIYRMETMRAYWPNKQIEAHIMSSNPSQWLDQVLPYSDTIYLHSECNDNLEELLKKIKLRKKKAGVALTMQTKPSDVKDLLEKADAVLLLTISKAGSSGQNFIIDGFDRISQVNALPFRKKLSLCVDGGVNEKIVGMLKAEKIVSGASVLRNPDPKRQILRLQTVGRYEAM